MRASRHSAEICDENDKPTIGFVSITSFWVCADLLFLLSASWKVEMTNNSIKQEIAVMKRLKHPNIVALHEVINDPTARKIFLIQEVHSF